MSDEQSTIYNDMLTWLDEQISVAEEERHHAHQSELLFLLISTKIIDYETAKNHLWELNVLEEVAQTRKAQETTA